MHIVKAICDVILKDVKGWKVFLKNQEQDKGVPSSTIPIQSSTGGPRKSSLEEKERKCIIIAKEEVKWSICRWHGFIESILNTQPKKNLLNLTNYCSNVVTYKIHIKQSVAFIYINN